MNFWSIALPGAGVAAGVAAWGAVHPTSELFGPTVHHTRRRTEIALTFDYGPNPAITPRLLELLVCIGARHIFFGRTVCARVSRAGLRDCRARPRDRQSYRNACESGGAVGFANGGRDCALRREHCGGAGERWEGGSAYVDEAPLRLSRAADGERGAACRIAGRGDVVADVLRVAAESASELIERLARVEVHSRVRGRRAGRESAGAGVNRGGDVILLHDGDFRAPGADQRHALAASRIGCRDGGMRDWVCYNGPRWG